MDDPIGTALRHAQTELRTVLATNKARRRRLAAIAKDRLAYQEYVDTRDSLDKAITNLYAKLQKRDGPKANKKKKKAAEPSNGANNGTSNGVPMPSPAALGLLTDDDQELSIPAQLKQLIETRRQWIDTVGTIFERKEHDSPGRIVGFPQTSIYEGVDEEVKQDLERVNPPQPSSSSHDPPISLVDGMGPHVNGHGAAKGKGKGRADSMAMVIG